MTDTSDGRHGRLRGFMNAWQLLLKAAGVLWAARRGLILASIFALVGLLLADLFGASEDGNTLAVVFGAVAGKALDILDDHFKWGERWLAVIAAVLGFLKLHGLRDWLIAHARAADATTAPPLGSPPTATTNVVVTGGSIVIGALVALAIAPIITQDDDPPAQDDDPPARVFATPDEAIAAQLARSTVQYVGPCDGSRMEPPRGGQPSDRRVCSVRMRAQEGGFLYGYVSAGGRTRSPRAQPHEGAELVILGEDQGEWQLVRCLVYCAYYGQNPVPP